MTDPSTPPDSENKPSDSGDAPSGPAPAADAQTGPAQAVDPQPQASKPRIKPKRQSRISWIWLVPLVAALIGLSLVVKDWLHAGPVVTISFESAEGLEVGQTKVRYKEVVIGTVTGIRVAPDRSKVLVEAELNRQGAVYITRKGTRFWVVRPRLGASGISGLGTLLSGAYIALDVGKDHENGEQQAVYNFTGLEKPPEITSDRPGTRYSLSAPDLGSLEIGSPVYYRHIQVGRVIGYDLDDGGKAVDIQIFIDAPNDKFVTADTRFWDISGINLSVSADGFTVNTGSVTSIISGGVAFASADEINTTRAKADTVFALASTEKAAMADPDGPAVEVDMEFRQSVRGLKVGAPIDFHGLELGNVTDIDLEFDAKAKRFYVLVKAQLFPLRFGTVYEERIKNRKRSGTGDGLLKPLIEHGLRAQIRAGNLLTGQQYVALDFFPDAEPVEMDYGKEPTSIPTVTGNFDRLQQQISSIVAKIDAVPFDGIGKDLRASLKSATALINSMQHQVAPAATATLKAAQRSLDRVDKLLAPDSSMNDNLGQTMRELNSAAKSLRALADYLQTHPTALLRGRPADVLPVEH